MARPVKMGLDYFPFNVDFFDDDKIEYVSARFDEKGELITVKLLCAIYKNGYFTDWDDDKALIFSKRAGKNTTPSLANDVVSELVKRGFFDRSIFNSFSILTSKGIQNRFLKAASDRKAVEINSDYWLIEIPESTKNTTFTVLPPINEVSPPVNSIKPPINPQSKVKEIKEKELIPPIPPKIQFAEFVSMTNADYEALVAKVGSVESAVRCIEILDNYKGSSGKKYKSDYRAILNWVIDRMNEQKTLKTNGNKDFRRTSAGGARPTADELNSAVEIGLAIAAAAENG